MKLVLLLLLLGAGAIAQELPVRVAVVEQCVEDMDRRLTNLEGEDEAHTAGFGEVNQRLACLETQVETEFAHLEKMLWWVIRILSGVSIAAITAYLAMLRKERRCG